MQSTLQRLRESSHSSQKNGSSPTDITGLHGASAALLLSRAAEELQQTICCILPSDDQLDVFAQDIGFFSSVPVLVYPSFEIPPYTPLSPDPKTVSSRLSTLYRLQTETSVVIVLTSAEAILRKILPKTVFHNHCELLMTGEEFEREELVQTLVKNGYQSCELVHQQGDFAVRGGIIDIFPPAYDEETSGPLRLDFFGDTLESIRQFDPVSQRSNRELEEAVLLPASDILFPAVGTKSGWKPSLEQMAENQNWPLQETRRIQEHFNRRIHFPGIEFLLPILYGEHGPLHSFFDYLPENARLVFHDPAGIRQATEVVRDRIHANHQEAVHKEVAACPPGSLFLTDTELEQLQTPRLLARFLQLPDPDSSIPPLAAATGDHTLLTQEIELQRKKRGLLAPLADRIIAREQKKTLTLLACKSGRQAGHLAEILSNYSLHSRPLHPPVNLSALEYSGEILLVDHPLSRGFDLTDENIQILSATELFGEKRLRKKRGTGRTDPESQPLPLDQLNPGDIVVHKEHGVGVFEELVNLDLPGHQGDFLLINYRNDDKLYVPVDKLHWVSKYQGLSDQEPKLDALGTQRWQTTKKKVTDAVWKVAQELLGIYAQRAIRTGHRFSPPGELYRELEESFPYDETPGQAKAIDDTLNDLTSEQPMDRLVCGDVGYGKTEVAARAAFKVIEDGFQVAILVPTTVLAEQHAATFRERFTSFPVETACLNRFRTAKQQKEIRSGLSDGSIDLVVGTHSLLSKEIAFNRLGLLIIDEEHRFGVSHKEKIKKMKASVDVLTLTATPIPRTLQMSLLGIRDLSVISTPPRQRRSVKTFLAKQDDLVIREAVLRELLRKGQLFFVHNRVRTIHRVAENISKLVPQARIGVGHGQMTGQQLEKVMVQFINHEIDILVCTTIIESGLDIPNANTIIINRADHLGLADIYQLRGRVGRSSRQAYAYLFVPSIDSLTGEAKKRLRALMDNSELGSGFKLAMNDLQIRGGGNLLGVSQSGHIAAVGYDLYLELLQATVADLKNKAKQKEEGVVALDFDPEVKLHPPAFLPDYYIADTTLRYQAYRRISALSNGTNADLEDMKDELVDRFGPLPGEAENLLNIIACKQQLRPLGINKLEQSPTALVYGFIEKAPVEPERLIMLVQSQPKKQAKNLPIRLTPDNRLVVPLNGDDDIFTQITATVNKLQNDEK